MADILCTPIGYISSPFKERGDAPRQGRLTEEISIITLQPEYLPATLGLDEETYIHVLCWFDRSDRTILQTHPAGDAANPLKGVFANRSPHRPNPISLTLAEVIRIEENRITVRGLEAFDGTPVLDIKPFRAEFDTPNK